MDITKMRHQLRRGHGAALVINGHRYGWTSGQVIRNYSRPLVAAFNDRQRPYGKALEAAMRALTSGDTAWTDPPGERLDVRVAEQDVVNQAADQPEDKDQQH